MVGKGRTMTRRDLLLLGLGTSGTLFGCATIPAPAAGPTKKLIEFGWDEPDTAFMRRHIAQMEQMPFDGVVFHVNYTTPEGKPGNFLWEAWGRRAFTDLDVNRDGVLTEDELRSPGTPPLLTPAFQAGRDRGLKDGRQAGREDREQRGAWDLEGQRELNETDAGYRSELGPRDQYQAGYLEGFRQGYAEGYGPRR